MRFFTSLYIIPLQDLNFPSMSPIKGRFYLRQTVNGNLSGEYSNDDSLHSMPECCCNKTAGASNCQPATFVGRYRSTWIEDPNYMTVSADLEIDLKPKASQIFDLKWIDPVSSKTLFRGQAMLAEGGILVGNYWEGRCQSPFLTLRTSEPAQASP